SPTHQLNSPIHQFTNSIHHITNSPIHQFTDSSTVDLLPTVRRTIEQYGLCRPGCRILVGLSGGADSVALLLILRELEAGGELTVAGVAHLNHLLRGADADDDERFCAELARRRGVRFISERVDVGALAKRERRSIEDAARRTRYAFFDRAAAACGA